MCYFCVFIEKIKVSKIKIKKNLEYRMKEEEKRILKKENERKR